MEQKRSENNNESSVQSVVYDAEQRQKIMNAVKAIHDYFDAARKIAPEYQQMAFDACIAAVVAEMSKG